MKKKIVRTLGEYEVWFRETSDSTHPEHKKWIAENAKAQKVWAKALPLFEGMAKTYAEAERILELAREGTWKDFYNLPPINAHVVLAIIVSATKDDQVIAKEIISKIKSDVAKHPRPSRTHKEKPKFLKFWNLWQAKPSLYKSDSEFIRDMMEQTGINRIKTIEKWIKDLRRLAS